MRFVRDPIRAGERSTSSNPSRHVYDEDVIGASFTGHLARDIVRFGEQ
jgi:hypothetical protein